MQKTAHETTSNKATRLKKNYRVIQVTERDFVVIGDHSTYKIRRFSDGWYCECRWTRFNGTLKPCSHIQAAQQVLLDPSSQVPVKPLAQLLAGSFN